MTDPMQDPTQLFERGDTFSNDYQELTVVGFRQDGRIEVENLAGTTDAVRPRELIEVATDE